MLADYWIVRKRDTDVPQLYDKTETSEFWFVEGFSVPGIASLVVGSALALPVVDLSWMVSLPIGFVTYLVLTELSLNRRLSEDTSSSAEEVAATEAD